MLCHLEYYEEVQSLQNYGIIQWHVAMKHASGKNIYVPSNTTILDKKNSSYSKGKVALLLHQHYKRIHELNKSTINTSILSINVLGMLGWRNIGPSS